MRSAAALSVEGLSPRVRGNLLLGLLRASGGGSIPASAGEPRRAGRPASPPGVYPRECGGTSLHASTGCATVGLSPRVRGNRAGDARRSGRGGSIPASAGEPPWWPWPDGVAGVYPRECGGTMEAKTSASAVWGLSPRVRGNPRRRLAGGLPWGSIPASAGEPATAPGTEAAVGVYPRECGGTAMARIQDSIAQGLSPRVRGNHLVHVAVDGGHGSIPASAGEPNGQALEPHQQRVYPRECGGTLSIKPQRSLIRGLSPRVRGNPKRGRDRPTNVGSIPASAGEPSTLSA